MRHKSDKSRKPLTIPKRQTTRDAPQFIPSGRRVPRKLLSLLVPKSHLK
jgi:hypothetical protein